MPRLFLCLKKETKLNQTTIKIIDKPCGSGKTTTMINGFNNNDKYLVIVPLLSEVERVIKQSEEVPFVQPHANDNEAGTKFASLEEQLLLGCNIVSTHRMYENLVPVAKAGLLDDYHIIIDEVPDIVHPIASKSSTSIEEFYVASGYMEVDEDSGLIKPTQKWIERHDQVSDTLSSKILTAAMSGCLYLQDNKMFIWALPSTILQAGRSLTVLTYKSEGSMFLSYLRKLQLPYAVEVDKDAEGEFLRQASELITLRDIPKLNRHKLSYTGQQQGQKLAKYVSELNIALKNLKERKLQGVAVKDILITCKKDAWIEASRDNKTKAGVFAKNSRLSKATWVANTTRGTNDYANCSHLIYLYDQHPNQYLTRWLGDSSREFADQYALTELVQWVWRSRIRKGEPITLYLPCPRMKKLFEEWLQQSNNKDDPLTVFQNNIDL